MDLVCCVSCLILVGFGLSGCFDCVLRLRFVTCYVVLVTYACRLCWLIVLLFGFLMLWLL